MSWHVHFMPRMVHASLGLAASFITLNIVTRLCKEVCCIYKKQNQSTCLQVKPTISAKLQRATTSCCMCNVEGYKCFQNLVSTAWHWLCCQSALVSRLSRTYSSHWNNLTAESFGCTCKDVFPLPGACHAC